MKRPEAAVDHVYQAGLVEGFYATWRKIGEEAKVEVPPADGAPRLDSRFSTVALREGKKLDRADKARSQMLIVGTMPSFIRATGLIESQDPRIKREQRYQAMADIQQTSLAIRSIANNFQRMSRRTFRTIAKGAASLYVEDAKVIDHITNRSDDIMWNMMHMLGIEGTLINMELLPDDESDHPGVVLPSKTQRLRQLATSPNQGSRLLVDVHTSAQKRADSIRTRGGERRIPLNERVFATNWSPVDFSPEAPMRVRDSAAEAIEGRLADTLEQRAA